MSWELLNYNHYRCCPSHFYELEKVLRLCSVMIFLYEFDKMCLSMHQSQQSQQCLLHAEEDCCKPEGSPITTVPLAMLCRLEMHSNTA